MKNQSAKSFMLIMICGCLMVACILIFGTYWTGKSASHDTQQAVRNVSLFYLDELAGRREQVVDTTLGGYISDMDVAIGLMERSDLDSIESLQSYQARMKQLYSLEKFAFVDEDGLIYTSMGTRTDIDLYSFDPNKIAGPEISVKNMDKDDKKVVIAVPTDRLPIEGKHLVACFMEIDMDHFLDVLSLQSETNSTTFCNLYTSDGFSLTNTVLGGLASENNLIRALENASFEDGYKVETIKGEFKDRQTGVTSFTYNGIRETLYYVPVHSTDWMLTYLIRESVISEQIGAISDDIIQRSLALSLTAAAMLAALFITILLQARRSAAITLEKEVSETEHRVKQQELEEQLALQEELLEQEKRRVQQDRMITALASDYLSVYYVDLDTDEGICYRNDRKNSRLAEGQNFKFIEAFSEYANTTVDEAYREGFLSFIDPENIRRNLEKESIISYRYLVNYEGVESYEMLRMAGVRHPQDRDDGVVHAIGVGFSDIDAEMQDSLSKSQALSDALKAAEEASKAKTVFLSNMSHEIRTPMNAIIGLDSLALHEPDLSDTSRDYLEKIGSSAQHLLSLINDILDMSRIESGRMTIHNEEFAFSKLVEQINIIFNGQAKEKGLEYICRIKGKLADYYIGDSTKLRQVLINILGNAVKFTPEGGRVEFTVEKTAAFDGKSTLLFVIHDTGIGMSKEFLPRLFETFSQESEGTTSKYGSSGLGMAITKNIVEMMNGRIEVASEKGVGTTFKVSVTLMDSDKKLSSDDADIELRPQELRVLVVDDDPIACDHAKLILTKEGIDTDTALSGADAIEMIRLAHARRKPYDLLIIDWQMPDMDGIETTKHIRSIIGDESAIIILSSYDWNDIRDEALEAGVDSFIAKPLFTGNLLDEFKNSLKKKLNKKDGGKKKAELSGRRILLAEDMAVNAQIMMEVLKMKGMEAEHAENGKVAVDMFAEHPEGYYDAVLMDVRMPEMDGLTATATIRDMDREDAKKVPIIALTANAFDEDVQRSLQAGLNAHLSKPVQPEVLFDTLENLIPVD